MKIFQDIFSDQELLSDSYNIVMTYGGVIGQVKSRMVVKKEGDVDIGCGNAFGGTNEQQEGGNGNQTPVEKVIDLVDAFRYEGTSFDKAGFGSYFKDYMKKLLEWLGKNKADRVEPFKAGARDFFKWVNANFDQLTFYTSSSYDMENLIILSYYKNEEDDAPTFLYVWDGLKFFKV